MGIFDALRAIMAALPARCPDRRRRLALCSVLPRGLAVFSLALFISALFGAAGPSRASDAAVQAFQSAAYQGQFQRGVQQLEALARADTGDVEAVFGLGAMRFFAAISDLQKGIRAHTTASTMVAAGGRTSGLFMLPLSGLIGGRTLGDSQLVPPNPSAVPMTYARLRQLLAAFASDMQRAEQTLAQVGSRPVKLPLKPFDVAFDLDQNGAIEDDERILVTLLGRGRRMQPDMLGTELHFDTADASWLRGYANVLLATVNVILSFDFEPAYAAGAHQLYGDSATAFGAVLARQAGLGRPRATIQAELDAVHDEVRSISRETSSARDVRDLRKQLDELERTPANAARRQFLEEALQNMTANQTKHAEALRRLRSEQRRLNSELSSAGQGWIYDAIAFVHTLNFAVVEPQRLEAARGHLVQVMTLNQATWRLVRAETDDDREWLPNPKQTAPFGAQALTDEIIDSWLAATALAADVLEGRKLLPHPRFAKGFNLKRLLQSARRVDFVLLATGHDLVPYLEDGTVADGAVWSAITQPMGRDVGQYALWFN